MRAMHRAWSRTFDESAHAVASSAQVVCVATLDGVVHLLDERTGETLLRFDAHAGGALCAAFSSSGRTLATGGQDGAVRLWPVDLLPVAAQRLPRSLTQAERQRYDLADQKTDGAGAAGPSAEPGP